jgi:hemoglobin
MSDQTLYQRLGGYDAIAAATDDLLGRLLNDPLLKDYWKGTSEASLRKDRQLIVDFLVAATGGPPFYTGRDMKTSHTGLGITEREWDLFLGHSRAMLDHLQVPARERDEVLDFLDGLKGDVVEGEARQSSEMSSATLVGGR